LGFPRTAKFSAIHTTASKKTAVVLSAAPEIPWGFKPRTSPKILYDQCWKQLKTVGPSAYKPVQPRSARRNTARSQELNAKTKRKAGRPGFLTKEIVPQWTAKLQDGFQETKKLPKRRFFQARSLPLEKMRATRPGTTARKALEGLKLCSKRHPTLPPKANSIKPRVRPSQLSDGDLPPVVHGRPREANAAVFQPTGPLTLGVNGRRPLRSPTKWAKSAPDPIAVRNFLEATWAEDRRQSGPVGN